jgi:hypothetical protein
MLTTANTAGIINLTCLPKQEGAKDLLSIFGHQSDDRPSIYFEKNWELEYQNKYI